VTSSDFEFASDEINFGHCSVYETVYQKIELSNKSVLSQQYGFVNLPEVCFQRSLNLIYLRVWRIAISYMSIFYLK